MDIFYSHNKSFGENLTLIEHNQPNLILIIKKNCLSNEMIIKSTPTGVSALILNFAFQSIQNIFLLIKRDIFNIERS